MHPYCTKKTVVHKGTFSTQLEETLLAYIEDEMTEKFLDIIHPTNKYVLFLIFSSPFPFFFPAHIILWVPKNAYFLK